MRKEMRINKVKEMLKEGKKVVGTFMVSDSRAVLEILANAGFDFVMIDSEHFMKNPETFEQLIITAESAGITPFVRIQENPYLIDRILSAGARGVMVPMVNTKEEAQTAVEVAKYAPIGKRGACNPRAATYGANGLQGLVDFYKTENDNIMLILQIETAQAVDNLQEILSVKGIDSIFIGRMDLSHSMGITGQFDHPKLIEKVNQIFKAGKEAGIPVSMVTFDAEDTNKYFEEGYEICAMSGDAFLLSQAANEMMEKVKKQKIK